MLLQTQRLVIRQALQTDASFILRLLNEPSYIQMIRDSGVRDEAAARAYILETYINSYHNHGFGLYVVIEKDSDQPVGIAGLVKREGLEIPDLGFAVLEEFSGKGYVLEACGAVMSYARAGLGIKTIAAITTEANLRSQKLLRRLGFTFIKYVKLKNLEKDFWYFELGP
ncbi:MAG TPA: GNAT family N-acetyltransferase [Bacteriovoracaceae bacterium]|nr:GNAT family N-acetyltransferase [Bacteriovoracaceae bacterium]